MQTHSPSYKHSQEGVGGRSHVRQWQAGRQGGGGVQWNRHQESRVSELIGADETTRHDDSLSLSFPIKISAYSLSRAGVSIVSASTAAASA